MIEFIVLYINLLKDLFPFVLIVGAIILTTAYVEKKSRDYFENLNETMNKEIGRSYPFRTK